MFWVVDILVGVLLCFAKVFWVVSRVLLWFSKLLLAHCSASQGVHGGFLDRVVAWVLLRCSGVLLLRCLELCLECC